MFTLINKTDKETYIVRRFGHNFEIDENEFKGLVAKGQVQFKANKVITAKDVA